MNIKTFSRVSSVKHHNHRKRNILLAGTALALIVTASQVSALSNDLSRTESVKPIVPVQLTAKQQPAVETPQKAPVVVTPTPAPAPTPTPVPEPVPEPAPTPVAAPPVDPNGCEAKDMWWRADNYECIAKPTPVAAPAPSQVATSVSSSTGSGGCATELTKYDWPHSVAHAVMMQESSNNPGIVNNNPVTKDYSVGCFQINLYGANAATRPSEEWLKIASNNVGYAYDMFVANGRSFIGQWGACKYVACI